MQFVTPLSGVILAVGLCLGGETSPVSLDAIDELLPVPKRDLVLAGTAPRHDGATTIAQLLDDYAASTSQTIVMSMETRSLVAGLPVGLDRELRIPAGRVTGFVESILALNHLAAIPLSTEEPRVLAIRSLDELVEEGVWGGLFVPADQVEGFAGHPAVPITTVVHVEHADVRQFSSSLRGLMSRSRIMSIQAAAGTRSLVVGGLGRDVARLVRMIGIIDARLGEALARAPESSPESTPEPGPEGGVGSGPGEE